MSAWWQFKALIRKNLLTLKRSFLMTLMEIFYPIVLMVLCYIIKLAFDSTKITWEEEGNLDEYLISKGNFGFDYKVYAHLTMFNQLMKSGWLGQDQLQFFNNYFQIMGIEDQQQQNLLISRLTNIQYSIKFMSWKWCLEIYRSLRRNSWYRCKYNCRTSI